MGYRGEDLDLRTPQTWSVGSGGEPSGRGSGNRGYAGRGPIWVDETLLATANHAFDVALAHRAGEVRIEHLLYALTRIEGAAEVLEKRGIRVASLRREAATVIASDIPVGLPANDTAQPRRSEAFEEALRLAATEALRRNAPGSVDDLLTVFLDIRPDLPGLGLLARHAIRVTRDGGETLPPVGRPGPPYEARFAGPVTELRERGRLGSGNYYVGEAPRTVRSELAASTADTIQNSRIEALEQMVRALSHDLQSERKSFGGMLQDMQRDFMAQRDDASRLGGGLYDRLQSLEQLVSSHRGGGDGGQLGERLQALEQALDRRFAELSRAWAPLSDRLQALEQTLAGGVGEANRQWAAASDKLKSLELALASAGRTTLDFSPISERLDVIEEALLAPDRDLTRDVGERLAALERLMQSQRAEIIAETEVLKADIATLSAAVARQPSGAEQMQTVAGLMEKGRGETVAAVTGPLLQRVNALATHFETRQDESAASLSQVAERLAAAERAITLSVQRAEESHKTYAQELADVHEALMKLNSNQHTLAGTIDQWRTHGSSELGLISKRMDGVEREVAKPVEMIEQMSVSLEAMHRITVARHHRRNRFWYWLFGTDDWVGASWPSQVAKLEAERALVKTVKR